MSKIVLGTPARPVPRDENGAEAAVTAFIGASMAANTLAAYRSDWARFERRCRTRGLASLPTQPATLAAYLAEAATQPAMGQQAVALQPGHAGALGGRRRQGR